MPCDISMPLPSASLPPWVSHLFPMPSPHKAMGPSTNDSNTCLKGSWSNNSFQSWTLMLKTCGFAVVVVLEQEGEGKKPWLMMKRWGLFLYMQMRELSGRQRAGRMNSRFAFIQSRFLWRERCLDTSSDALLPLSNPGCVRVPPALLSISCLLWAIVWFSCHA